MIIAKNILLVIAGMLLGFGMVTCWELTHSFGLSALLIAGATIIYVAGVLVGVTQGQEIHKSE